MTDKQVLVNVDDLVALRTQHEYESATTFQYDPDSTLGKAVSRMVAAIPAPPWEPSDEQIFAYARGYGFRLPSEKEQVCNALRRLYNAGLIS